MKRGSVEVSSKVSSNRNQMKREVTSLAMNQSDPASNVAGKTDQKLPPQKVLPVSGNDSKLKSSDKDSSDSLVCTIDGSKSTDPKAIASINNASKGEMGTARAKNNSLLRKMHEVDVTGNLTEEARRISMRQFHAVRGEDPLKAGLKKFMAKSR